MRKFYTFLSVMCVATVTLMLSACSSRDYRDTLPADATAVIAVNPQSWADKAEVGDFTQSIYYQMAQMLLAQQQMSAEDSEYLLQMIAHPGTTGLDVEKDMFVFVGKDKNTVLSQPEVGMLFNVKNPKEVETFLGWIAGKIGVEPQTENGVTFLEIADQYTTYIAYTKESFLLYTETNPEVAEVKATVMQLLSQKKSESLMAMPEIASALNEANDMQLVFRYAALMNMPEMNMQIPGFEFLSKMSYVGKVNFEVGKIVSEGKAVFSDKEAEKQYQAMMEAFSQGLNGKFLSMLPEKNMAVLAVALQGEKIYGFLEQNPIYGMIFSSVPQLAPIMKSIAGDFSLSFHGMLADGQMPALSMLVDLRDAADLNTIMELFTFEFVEMAPNQYQVKGFPVYFGLNGNMLYVTTDASALDYLTGKSTSNYKPLNESIFRNSYVAMEVDLVQVREMLNQMVTAGQIDPQMGIALSFLGLFESIESSTDMDADGKLVINMTNKEKNALAVLYETIEGLAQMGAAMAM